MGRARIDPASITDMQTAIALRTWQEAIIRVDGDRDHMNESRLTVEQTMHIYDLMGVAAEKLITASDPAKSAIR